MLLDGLHLPLTTPFYSDGRLNVPKLEHNVARYSKTPVAGLVALGDSAESTLLSDEETRRVLRGVVGAAVDEKVLIAGISRDSVVGTLDLAGWAAEFGYDAVLVKRPSIFRANVRGESAKDLLTYFQSIADRSPLPVILWSEDGALLPVEMIIELAGHPMILGLVDRSSELAGLQRLKVATAGVKRDVTVTAVFAAVTRRMQTQRGRAGTGELISASTLTDGAAVLAPAKIAAKTRTKVVGFQILAGRTAGMLEGLKAGAAGAMPGFAAAAPQACYEVLAAWKDGDEGLAWEKQERLADVAKRVEEEMGVAGIKFGCDLNGYFGGWPRLPLLPLTGAERAEIEVLMQGMRH